jgi:lysophospholipase L1-like esterase
VFLGGRGAAGRRVVLYNPAMLGKKLAAVGVSVALALVAAEGAVRALDLAPQVSVIERGRFRLSRNPLIGYEPVPGLDYRGDDLSFFDYTGASNSLGYRDREHPVEKPPGTWRVVVIGDSIAAGLKVERFAHTLPPLLEGELRAAGVPAEVISLAVSGYNTRQEVETLRDRGLAFAPDLVLVAYSLTDRERVDGGILATLLAEERGADGVDARQVAHTEIHPVLAQSALLRALRYRVLPPPPPDPELARGYEELLVGEDTVAPALADLARLADEHGFRVAVAVFPRLVRNFRRYPFADEHRYVARIAEEHGFHFIDLLPAFTACRQATGDSLKLDHFHPSAAGHRCAAEAVGEALLAQVELPGEGR